MTLRPASGVSPGPRPPLAGGSGVATAERRLETAISASPLVCRRGRHGATDRRRQRRRGAPRRKRRAEGRESVTRERRVTRDEARGPASVMNVTEKKLNIEFLSFGRPFDSSTGGACLACPSGAAPAAAGGLTGTYGSIMLSWFRCQVVRVMVII